MGNAEGHGVELFDAVNAAIGSRLAESRHLLLVSHLRPDGDAVGSLLGLGLALQESGRSVQMVLADGTPSAFGHLVGADRISAAIRPDFDVFIALDCAESMDAGNAAAQLGPPNINVDHHASNPGFGTLNLVDSSQVSTSAVIARHMSSWGLSASAPVAAALLTGIISETLGFRTANVTAATMRQVADLMDQGADLPSLYLRAEVGIAVHRRIRSAHGK